MALRFNILSASGAVGNMLAAELLHENLLEAGDRLSLVGNGTDSTEDGFSRSRMFGSTRSTTHGLTSPQICPYSQSRLTRADLCAQMAPLDRYGLAELSSALVDGLLALATWSKDALRARGTSADRQRRFQRL
jgi:hypothetical protein